MYLRNLFFRTSSLLLVGATPVFIFDGVAPELKYNVMNKRLNDKKNVPKKNMIRSRLNSLQKQCELLFKIMGVTSIYSPGEAEKLCAVLNKNGIVNGVITQDSDCFLYGARIVYRNFVATGSGSIDVYQMEVIEDKLKMGRNKMIAMSLLCGCDYDDKGVNGVGKETAFKFLQPLEDSLVLDRLRYWRNDIVLNAVERDIKSQSDDIKLEIKIRSKALKNENFPSEDVIEEFLNTPRCPDVDPKWVLPDINTFITFAATKLCWDEDYAIGKFLPLLTRWHLLNDDNNQSGVIISEIIKKRINKGISCFEIKWKNYELTTIEPQEVVKIRYPNEVLAYVESNTKPTKQTRKKNNIEDGASCSELTSKIFSLNISTKNKNSKGPLDQFIIKNMSENDTLTLSDFENDSTDLDLSEIINKITL
ncbi:flap endonuclease GEN-like isoform X1 [Daktulosphaira vitifoliae]|nr:flap endonuclease GEN-like isoform X1 [Daktulosphaira vitifoliae]